jgi:hypothetical protein
MVVTHNDILNAIVNAENIAFMYSQARVNTLSNGILPTAEQNAAIIELEAWINILEIAEAQWEEGCITSDDTWQVIQNINELSQRVPCNVSRTFSRNSSSGGGGSTTTGYVERVFAYLVAANAPEVLNTIVDNSNPSRPNIKLFIDGITLTGAGTEEDPLVAAGGSGSGTVNNGTQYRISYYAATGTAVSQANAITANRALISDGNGVPTHSSVTATTLGYLDATSSVQTQLNGKQASLGFTPENVANKATNFTTLNSTLYPTTQAVADYVAQAVAGLLDLRGTYDASTNLFPSTGGSGTAGAILKGDLWVISVAGTLGGESVIAGQSIFANVDTPAQTAANWEILPVGIITTPTLQQVLDAGHTSTTNLSISDGTDTVAVKKDVIVITNGLGGEAAISSPTLTDATEFRIPNKAAGIETFAMLSDITGSGNTNTVYLNNAALVALGGASGISDTTFYVVTDASAGRLLTKGKTTTTIEDGVLNLTTGESGVYDLSTDKFYPLVQNFEKSLTAVNIKAAGYFDITELPAVSGAYWRIEQADVRLTGATTPYDGTPKISITINGASAGQFADDRSILAGGTDFFGKLLPAEILTGAPAPNIVSNAKAQVYIGNASTAGDGTLKIYGSARLITL